jgi:hypothetical protein
MRTIRMDDLLPQLEALFPDVPEKTIRQLLRRGSHNLGRKMAEGNNIDVSSSRKGVRMLVYYPTKLPPKPTSDEQRDH